MIDVGIILTVVFVIFFILVRKKIRSSYVFFGLLACMTIPNYFGNEEFVELWLWPYNVWFPAIVIFSVLVCLGFLPWVEIDALTKKSIKRLSLNPKYEKRLEYWMITLLALSFYSIIYILPFAIESMHFSSSQRRVLVECGHSFLPRSIFTTIATGGAACNIYCLLMFFVVQLSDRLKKYKWWLLAASLSYPVNAIVSATRDAFVIYILLILSFYLFFRPAYKEKVRRKMKNIVVAMCVCAAAVIAIISISRFILHPVDSTDFLNGTIGYISQQPYVFNNVLIGQDSFIGYDKSFPILNFLTGTESTPYIYQHRFEWMFPTHYGDFYNMAGWKSLVLMSAIMIGWFAAGFAWLYRKRSYMGLMLLFAAYCYLFTTGIFYFRACYSVPNNIFWLAALIIPFFVKKYVVENNENYDSADKENIDGNKDVSVVMCIHTLNDYSLSQLKKISKEENLEYVKFLFVVKGDDLAERIKAIMRGAEVDYEIRVVREDGFNAMRSHALEVSTHYIFFNDCDDDADYKELNNIIKGMDRKEEIVECYNVTCQTYEKNGKEGEKRILYKWGDGIIEDISKCGTSLHGKIIPRYILQKSDFVDLPFAEDFAMACRIFMRLPHRRHSEALYTYRVYADSPGIKNSINPDKARKVARYYEEYIDSLHKEGKHKEANFIAMLIHNILYDFMKPKGFQPPIFKINLLAVPGMNLRLIGGFLKRIVDRKLTTL